MFPFPYEKENKQTGIVWLKWNPLDFSPGKVSWKHEEWNKSMFTVIAFSQAEPKTIWRSIISSEM